MAKLSSKWALLFSLTLLVLLSGCLKIQVREEIKKSGPSDVTFTIEAINQTNSESEKPGEDPCKTLNVTNPKFTNMKCRYDGKKITLSGNFDRRSAGGLTVAGSVYRLDVAKAVDGFNEESKSKQGASMPKDQKAIKELKDSGFTYDYYVKMPGSVTGQAGGLAQPDGSVKFDLVDLPDGAYVESTTSSILDSLGGGAKEEDENNVNASSCCCIPLLPAVLAGFAGLAAAASKAIL